MYIALRLGGFFFRLLLASGLAIVKSVTAKQGNTCNINQTGHAHNNEPPA
jgi:hypothetical protein